MVYDNVLLINLVGRMNEMRWNFLKTNANSEARNFF